MGILKGFRWLAFLTYYKRSLDVQNGFFYESLSFEHHCIREVISFSDISAVNFIVRWNVLACSMKRSTSFLLQSQREKTLSMTPFHSLGLVLFVELKLFQSPS